MNTELIFPSMARKAAFECVAERVRNKECLRVLEIGSIRSPHSAETDGHSTLFFKSLVGNNPYASLTSVDKNPACVGITIDVLGGAGLSCENVRLITGDALGFLRDFNMTACDLVYLDGVDYYDKKASMEWHLSCFLQFCQRLMPGTLVAIDDNMDTTTFDGKGKPICSSAGDMGFKIVHNSYVVVLEKV